MNMTRVNLVVIAALSILLGLSAGCQYEPYAGVVRPTVAVSLLSPELAHLTDAEIETYLQADARPRFPSVLAVAGFVPQPRYGRDDTDNPPVLIHGDEAEGWRKLATPDDRAGLIRQVQFINPLLAGNKPTLKHLRDAAAQLHAPLLLVYLQADQYAEGYNDLGMAYWTIIGLFTVPGNTVGHYTLYQGVLVDTRSGFILATVSGEAKREENVLPGAVPIASDRTKAQAEAAAFADLQDNVRAALTALAERSAAGQ
jgi:hypothetical protein